MVASPSGCKWPGAVTATPEGSSHRHIAGHLLQRPSLYMLQRELVTDQAVNLPEAGIVSILTELQNERAEFAVPG